MRSTAEKVLDRRKKLPHPRTRKSESGGPSLFSSLRHPISTAGAAFIQHRLPKRLIKLSHSRFDQHHHFIGVEVNALLGQTMWYALSFAATYSGVGMLSLR